MSEKRRSVATIRESKKGNLYLHFEQNVKFFAKQTLFINSKEESIKNLIKLGKLTEEAGKDILEKYGYIKYELFVPEKKAD